MNITLNGVSLPRMRTATKEAIEIAAVLHPTDKYHASIDAYLLTRALRVSRVKIAKRTRDLIDDITALMPIDSPLRDPKKLRLAIEGLDYALTEKRRNHIR